MTYRRISDISTPDIKVNMELDEDETPVGFRLWMPFAKGREKKVERLLKEEFTQLKDIEFSGVYSTSKYVAVDFRLSTEDHWGKERWDKVMQEVKKVAKGFQKNFGNKAEVLKFSTKVGGSYGSMKFVKAALRASQALKKVKAPSAS